MIQANILLSLIGKTAGSFAVMDLMRLPLGIGGGRETAAPSMLSLKRIGTPARP
jgi:hypothetical protein